MNPEISKLRIRARRHTGCVRAHVRSACMRAVCTCVVTCSLAPAAQWGQERPERLRAQQHPGGSPEKKLGSSEKWLIRAGQEYRVSPGTRCSARRKESFKRMTGSRQKDRDLPEGFSLAKSGHFEHQDNYRLLKDDNPCVHSSNEYK